MAVSKLRIISINIAITLPAFAAAADNNFSSALSSISNLINILTKLAFSLAFLAFFYGFAKLIFNASEEKRKQAIDIMITSVTVIFIMVSVWGIVMLLKNTLGIGSDRPTNIRTPKLIPTNI